MPLGSGLARIGRYPFEVRHSDGALLRDRVAAGVASRAYAYFSNLFSGVEPDIVVMSAAAGDFWTAIVEDLRYASPLTPLERDLR